MNKPKITTIKKEKDPKLFLAGKKLALISKQARENKMRMKIEAENKEKSQDEWNVNYVMLLGGIGAITRLVGIYYMRRDDIRETKHLETEPKHVVIEKKETPKSKSNLDSFDLVK